SNPGESSMAVEWNNILHYNPEALVIAPCGFNIDRTGEELRLLMNKPGWNELQAVQNKSVFIADYDLFTQPAAGSLVDGIELLAALFHPDIFTVPPRLEAKYRPAL